MDKYVAFLRGINVGGRIIKMAELKICFEKAGFKGIRTFLQSGNVTFESDKSESALKIQIQDLLTKTFSYPAKVQVVSLDNLKKIIAANAFGDAPKDYHQYVIFIENNLEVELVAETGKLLNEAVQAGPAVVYWKVQKGQTLKSPFSKLLSKSKYKEFNTVRNLNTLKKIASL